METSSAVCPNCGAATEPGWTLCSTCGRSLSDQWICDKCGEANDSGFALCSRCDELRPSLAGSAEPTEPPAAPAPAEVPRATEQATPLAEAATKICPQCAEEVKAAALICHYCRYEFGPLPPAGQAGT
jgi:predicted amidophosphoribosyltransferase